MKRNSILTIIGIVILAAALGTYYLNSAPLKGTWTASGQAGQGISWTLSYTFTKNSYTLTGYPEISEQGTYTIISADESPTEKKYTLRMVPSKDKEAYDLNVILLPGNNLRIGTMDGNFLRVK